MHIRRSITRFFVPCARDPSLFPYAWNTHLVRSKPIVLILHVLLCMLCFFPSSQSIYIPAPIEPLPTLS